MLEPLNPVIHFPTIPMERFGTIDPAFGGGPKYRCIWAPSRTIIVQPESGVQTLFMYAGPRALNPLSVNENTWVLEKWMSPSDLYDGTEDEWNADSRMLATGFYPKRGDFVLCEAIHLPSLEYVEKVILMIEDGNNRHSRAENTIACVDRMKREQAAKKTKKHDIITNAMRPWGAESYSAALSMRNSKTYEQRNSVQDLGLPGEGVTKSLVPKRRVTYEVPVAV